MTIMTGIQSRAARVLLGWSQEDLAERALINVSSVKRLEAGSSAVTRVVESAVAAVFSGAGVTFLSEGERFGGRKVLAGVVVCVASASQGE